MTDAILFDFNGVIVDDEEQHRMALTRVLEGFGLSLQREDYYAHYLGLDDRLSFAEAFRLANRTMPSELLRHLVAEKSQRYRSLIAERCTPVPGAIEFVRAAQGDFRLAIVSGALHEEIDLVLDRLGIRDCFAVIVAAEHVLRSKPHPAGYQAALAALAAQPAGAPRRSVAIEDSPAGIAAARAAGLPSVAITTSVPRAQLADAAVVWASFSGHSPAELAPLLAP